MMLQQVLQMLIIICKWHGANTASIPAFFDQIDVKLVPSINNPFRNGKILWTSNVTKTRHIFTNPQKQQHFQTIINTLKFQWILRFSNSLDIARRHASKSRHIIQNARWNPIHATTTASYPLGTLVTALAAMTSHSSIMTKAQFLALDFAAVFVVAHYIGATHLTARDRHQIYTLLVEKLEFFIWHVNSNLCFIFNNNFF